MADSVCFNNGAGRKPYTQRLCYAPACPPVIIVDDAPPPEPVVVVLPPQNPTEPCQCGNGYNQLWGPVEVGESSQGQAFNSLVETFNALIEADEGSSIPPFEVCWFDFEPPSCATAVIASAAASATAAEVPLVGGSLYLTPTATAEAEASAEASAESVLNTLVTVSVEASQAASASAEATASTSDEY